MTEPMYDDDLGKIKAIILCSSDFYDDLKLFNDDDARKAISMLMIDDLYAKATGENSIDGDMA